MDEPLLGTGPFAVDVDAQACLATVRARVPGPAGTVALDLGGGMEVDIDVADPAALAGLMVELPLTGDPGRVPRAMARRLDVLLGADITAQVAAAVRASAPTGGPDGRPPVGIGGRGPGVARSLRRGALARATACEAGAPRAVRAVGLLEAAVALDPVAAHGLLDLRAAARRDAEVGAELLVEVAARRPLALADRRTAAALAALLAEAQHLLEPGSARARTLAALAGAIERGDHTVYATDGAEAPAEPTLPASPSGLGSPSRPAPPRRLIPPARPAPLARRVPVHVHALPGPLTGVAIAARQSAPSEVEVHIDGRAERRHGLWARAFDATDDTLLGIAPFVRDPSAPADAVARVVVPPATAGRAGRRLEVDVTDRPEMPRPSPTLALVERARYQGTRAARAERLGDRAEAHHLWSACARLWRAAGDPERAAEARTRAKRPGGEIAVRGGEAGPSTDPLVCDLVYGS